MRAQPVGFQISWLSEKYIFGVSSCALAGQGLVPTSECDNKKVKNLGL